MVFNVAQLAILVSILKDKILTGGMWGEDLRNTLDLYTMFLADLNKKESAVNIVGTLDAARNHFDPNRVIPRPAITTILMACDQGLKISAIKELREWTGLGLKESKDLVEAWMKKYE